MLSNNRIYIIPISIFKDNYVWLIIDTKKALAWAVDPGDANSVLKFLHQHHLNLSAILITHHHWDHINGIAELKNQYDIPVYGPMQEKIALVSHPLKESDEIKVAGLTLTVMDTPGHTLGHISYYSSDLLFCGDTLFAAGCGRIFEGTPKQMYTSLKKIAALPDNTKIYCTHEYTLQNLHFAQLVEPHNPEIKKRFDKVTEQRIKNIPSLPSTVCEEKKTNPFLRCESPEIKANVERYAGFSLQNPIDVFAYLRQWKDDF